MENLIIRPVQPSDNAALATIIRNSLAEFGANKPGTVYFDASTDNLATMFQKAGSVYFVALSNGQIIGGAGIYPSDGLPGGVCELVKMYLSPHARDMGLGRRLIDECIAAARQKGYQKMYLETMPELKQAVKVYEKFGFTYLEGPLGNTGHFGCNVWMLKDL